MQIKFLKLQQKQLEVIKAKIHKGKHPRQQGVCVSTQKHKFWATQIKTTTIISVYLYF